MASATLTAGAAGALAGTTQSTGPYNPIREQCPLRQDNAPDSYDSERIQ